MFRSGVPLASLVLKVEGSEWENLVASASSLTCTYLHVHRQNKDKDCCAIE